MASCKRPDISERLLSALSPEEFPEDAQEIEEHLKVCPSCRDKLEMLRRIDTMMKTHKGQLADSLVPCPSAEVLFEFAGDRNVSPSVQSHIESCDECKRYVELLRELSQLELEQGKRSATWQEKALIRETVSRLDGRAEQPRSHAFQNILHSLKTLFYVPSLAVGAAIAALIFLFLVPQQPGELTMIPALSGVTWEKSIPGEQKGGLTAKQPLLPRKKVALLILLSPELKWSAEDVDNVYRKLDLADRLGAAYEFIAPKEIKKSLSDSPRETKLGSAVAQLFEKSDADYVLTFEVFSSKRGNTLKGELFKRGEKQATGSIAQTGLPASRIPSRIRGMGAELLLQAETS